MKKILLLILSFFMISSSVLAEEGMWLLPYLNKLNIKDMKAKGLKLKAEDIYNINNASLKDAIVIFGGGCTGEVISSQGLVLTNHHCGYGSIQKHSTVENDYLKDGFWAMNKKEEIPTPGLAVTFIKSMTDVTNDIVPQLNESMSPSERSRKISELSRKIIDSLGVKKPGYRSFVQDMFAGNQFMLFVTQSYNDVRLVGAPPTSIGKFGGETDNWMWPRHTGDFSLFRIYADKDGNPAEYSVDNVPLVPVKHLSISLEGVKKNDFTMIMGFPGRTNRYMSSYEIDETLNQSNPIRIFVRGVRQDILKKDMQSDPKIQIQYASKYAGSSNYWKNSIGMSRGLRKLNVKEDKEKIESEFTEWVNADPQRKATYGEALKMKKDAIEGRMPLTKVVQYLNEALGSAVEILKPGDILLSTGYISALENNDEKRINELKPAILNSLEAFYKDYNAETDRKVAKAMIKLLRDSLDKEDLPSVMSKIDTEFGGDVNTAVDYIYDNSIFYSLDKMKAFLNEPDANLVNSDFVIRSLVDLRDIANKYNGDLVKYNTMFNTGHRLFVAGMLEKGKDKAYYPDANFTLRLTYGQVLPYNPADAVVYDYKTTLKGVIDKEDPNNLYEFEVPVKLKELYKKKDYGRYGKDELVTCFISNNDITGGNSGSPVLNKNGELVGTAFDGNWEAMSGDIAFEPDLQRTISVDIRYTLFIIDKFAGASHLIDEMTIVK